ncbi:PspC domain-containing protein [candidate division KSB1 bacterium]|nr:PspC domain-containing protein [candidate division KSB1 bacterium]
MSNGDINRSRLFKSQTNKMVAGVCGGVAEYFNIDATVVRIIWIISVFLDGLGIVAYLACLILMRENPDQASGNAPQTKTNSAMIWGIVLIVIGMFALSRRYDFYEFPFHFGIWQPFFNWHTFFPVLIILAGIFYIVYVLKKDNQPETAEGTSENHDSKRLTRISSGKIVSGVCAGIANYLNIDVIFVRIGWILLTLYTHVFIGVVAYVVLIFTLPEEHESTKSWETTKSTDKNTAAS